MKSIFKVCIIIFICISCNMGYKNNDEQKRIRVLISHIDIDSYKYYSITCRGNNIFYVDYKLEDTNTLYEKQKQKQFRLIVQIDSIIKIVDTLEIKSGSSFYLPTNLKPDFPDIMSFLQNFKSDGIIEVSNKMEESGFIIFRHSSNCKFLYTIHSKKIIESIFPNISSLEPQWYYFPCKK